MVSFKNELSSFILNILVILEILFLLFPFMVDAALEERIF